MAVRRRVLVAAQPEAWSELQRLLNGAELLTAHSINDALRLLDREAATIGLIVATLAFDESRMIEFLQAVKRNPATRAIPFLCTRILSGVLSDEVVASMSESCKQCGAAEFIDIAKLPPEAGQGRLSAAVMAYLQAGEARPG